MKKEIIRNQTPEEGRIEFSNACENLISALNEYIFFRLGFFIAELKKKPYYKQEIKRYANLAEKALQTNVKAAHSRFLQQSKNDSVELMRLRSKIHNEYVDSFSELFHHDAEKLTNAFIKICEEEGTKEFTETFCHIEIIRLLLQMSCQSYDEMCQGTEKKCGVNYYATYLFYRPGQAFKCITDLEDRIQKIMPDVAFNFNQSPTVMNAFRKLQDSLVTGKYLTQAAVNAFEEYYDELPDNYKEIHEENKRQLSLMSKKSA